MCSGSYMNLLNLITVDDYGVLNRKRKMGRTSGIVSDLGVEEEDAGDESEADDPVSSASKERMIIVANQLPIKASHDLETKEWSFKWDSDSLVLQLKDGFDSDVQVLYVGSLKAEVDVSEQDHVAKVLLDTFQCVPTFLPAEIHNKFYHGFCKHYLWPLFHYLLPMSPAHGARFDKSLWQAYLSANKIFAEKVTEVMNLATDYVWVHDYHLMVLPTLLRKKFHEIRVGFFLHSPFPSSEIYRTLPVREEILKAFLNCDLVGFHTFDYARHFLSCCSRMLGLDYECKRGYIGLEYYGRTVSIKILPVGIHMGHFNQVLSLDETAAMIKRLTEEYKGKFVILGMDDMDIFKGLNSKFLAMGQLLQVHQQMIGKAVLVQILNPARSSGTDIQIMQSEMNAIADDINERFGRPGYKPIVVVDGPVTTQVKAAYCAISDCCIVNAVRDGMNLVPYKYTVCRQGSLKLDAALGVDDDSEVAKTSVIIVSEFIGCSPSLSGAIRVSPWNIDDVAEAMRSAISMSDTEKHLRHEKHFKFVSSHDVAYWARSFTQDLVRACDNNSDKRCWGFGLGLAFRVVALSENFRKLSVRDISNAYKNTKNRLILLDYDGTVIPRVSVDKSPSNTVISVLNSLCGDVRNTVFIVSGRGKDCLSYWFSPCEKLGISAEHGFFTRWRRDSEWETCELKTDFCWKKMAEPVMMLYTETTDGSFIEHKESALVWHHDDADSHFGSSQAKELLDHLDSVLANDPVMVKRGQLIVEVKPQGVSKGLVVENLISALDVPPDFVLCIGDDRSDEDMFETIAAFHLNPAFSSIGEVFACTVGQKPSMAKYYLDDTHEVLDLLGALASESQCPQI